LLHFVNTRDKEANLYNHKQKEKNLLIASATCHVNMKMICLSEYNIFRYNLTKMNQLIQLDKELNIKCYFGKVRLYINNTADLQEVKHTSSKTLQTL